MKAFAAFSILAVALFAGVDAVHFSYREGEHDPNHWGGTCQSGNHQSPINIPSGKGPAHYTYQFSDEYKTGFAPLALNNGHTVQLSENKDTTSNATVNVTINGVSTKYVFAQLHCHWESEHRLDNKTFDVECHLVHYREDIGSVSEAVAKNDPNGLLVIGVFYDAKENQENKAFEVLTKNIPEVTKADATNFHQCSESNPLVLHDLLPIAATNRLTGDIVHNVAVYNGSLTTPGCSEIVLWMVFTKPVAISKEQLEAFDKLKDDENEELVHNYRPVQPLNERTVTHATITEKVRQGDLDAVAKIIESVASRVTSFFQNLFKPKSSEQ